MRVRPAVAAIGVLLVLAGCRTDGPASTSATAATASPAAPVLTSPAIPGSESSVPPAGNMTGTAIALDVLEQLPVKGRAPKTGYQRALFGDAWIDEVHVEGGYNGCRTREDILRRDLTDLVLKPGTRGCAVLTGILHDPYTGNTIHFLRGQDTSALVQIDHVVALSDSWQKGAQQLSQQQRENLANDPLNLLAVDGKANQSKGAGDAATWLPANKPVRCQYVARQVSVKAKYQLWVTEAERDAIVAVLDGCPGQPLPNEAQVAIPPPTG